MKKTWQIAIFTAFLLSFMHASLWAKPLTAIQVGHRFWQYWGDGKAELASYDLTYPRYGQLRSGTAVTVFVTEDFSNKIRVKADAGKHSKKDTVATMKLNLIQDFATGIYDYNLMTSSFIALKKVNARIAGSPLKVSFGSQEWCGQVYQQALFHAKKVDYVFHSYFDGEADQQGQLPYPNDGITEDALWHWARGFASPALKPGQSQAVSILRSMTYVRLKHRPMTWQKGLLSIEASKQTITTPAGKFEVRRHIATITGELQWTFFVEVAWPHRIIQWQSTAGHKAVLRGSTRLPYWKMNANGMEKALSEFGLTPRQPHTP